MSQELAFRIDDEGDDESADGRSEAIAPTVEPVETEAATPAEAAAVAAAVSAHLTDRAVAAARAAADDEPETISPWTFSGRLDAVGGRSRRRPQRVERGSEWTAAARTF
ncbi:MAG: hypothetical protein ABEJ31_09460 [Haloarculaceae archaeon]